MLKEINYDKLGLTKNELLVYTTLLELGGGHASTVARKAKLPRVNCYYTLESLNQKGLISIVSNNNTKYFTPEPPQKILDSIEEKSKYAKLILPELLSLSTGHAFKPKIKYFEGIEGVKNIFKDILESEQEILGYSNLKGLAEAYGEHLSGFYEEKINKKIKSRIICPSSSEAIEFSSKFYPKEYPKELFEVLFINPREFWFEHEISIYGNKVAVISLDKEEIIGMIFESEVYAKSQTAIFNLAWLGASSFIAI
jgi:sugar-specific transcriptional regulator TrmB